MVYGLISPTFFSTITECVRDLDTETQMIIFKSFLTTLEVRGSCKNCLKPKTIISKLSLSNHSYALKLSVIQFHETSINVTKVDAFLRFSWLQKSRAKKRK